MHLRTHVCTHTAARAPMQRRSRLEVVGKAACLVCAFKRRGATVMQALHAQTQSYTNADQQTQP
eukprot:363539-Chlamydomonas_euryale.AAC.5